MKNKFNIPLIKDIVDINDKYIKNYQFNNNNNIIYHFINEYIILSKIDNGFILKRYDRELNTNTYGIKLIYSPKLINAK